MTAEQFLALVERRTDAIWMEEPEDLRRARSGIVPSGAGSYGQLLPTLLHIQSETRGLMVNAFTGILRLADDSDFTLEHLKKAARVAFATRAGFLRYLGMSELGGLVLDYLRLIDDVDDRVIFVRVTAALKTYGARVHLWTLHSFPWEIGMALHQFSPGEIRDMSEWIAGPSSPAQAYARS